LSIRRTRLAAAWLALGALHATVAHTTALAQALPKVPETPAVPKAPKVPATPKAPSVPSAPKAPKTPTLPEDLDDEELPETPQLDGEALGGEAPAPAPLPDEGAVPTPEEEPPPLPIELRGESVDETVELDDQSSTLSIEEIVNGKIVSASNREESSLNAPAWVITLTQEDFRKRGYSTVDEVLSDLPGIDVVRPYGDTQFKDYWRGSRTVINSSYLLLLDGVVMNHLWYENTQVMAAFPLSNVERVEILFGPASAVYGPNAATGVINVITRSKVQQDGVHVTSRMSVGSPQHSAFAPRDLRKIGDMQVLIQRGDLRFSVTGRFDYAVLDPSIGNDFEYTKTRYYADRALWGDFVDRPELAGSFRPPQNRLSVDGRLFYGNTEVAAQFYQQTLGNGSVYPADVVQTNAPISYLDHSYYLRHTQNFSALSTTTLIRYRINNVGNPTTFLFRSSEDGTVIFDQTKSANDSVTFQQDFRLSAGRGLVLDQDELLFDFGAKYEYKDLQKSFVGTSSSFSPGQLDPLDWSTVAQPPAPGYDATNRAFSNNIGVYLLGKYQFLLHHSLNLGARVDYRQLLGQTAVNVRGGYIGRFFDSLTAKLLYGQASQEPTARELFGGAPGRGNVLKAENSQTLELNLNYVTHWVAGVADVYWAQYRDVIVPTSDSKLGNLGERDVAGLDVGVQALPPIDFLRALKIWLYYSSYLYAKESAISTSEEEGAKKTGTVRVGDLSHHKLMGGLTVDFTARISATVLARWYSMRRTVQSNPIRHIDSYATVDLNLLFQDVGMDGLWLDLRCTNLLGASYLHPGIREADSGKQPGAFDANGVWTGSAGLYNSALPQPGRAFMLTLGTDF
jgi:outer membrane receptor for ferrienterochelin and colicins